MVVGLIARPKAGVLGAALAFILGTVIIFAGGAGYLALLTGQDLALAVTLGVTPFLVGAVVKILLALVILRVYRRSRPGQA